MRVDFADGPAGGQAAPRQKGETMKAPSSGMSQRIPVSLLIGIVVVAAVGGVVFLLAALRAMSPLELNYNEGWNAFFQQRAARGEQLYDIPGGLISNNYPPLSFIIVGWLSNLGLDPIGAARFLSLVSALAIPVFAGVAAMRLSGAGRTSFLATAACCFGLLVLAFPNYVGINDPQFLAQAVMAGAMAVYLSNPRKTSTLAATIALMALAGMMKHNILAFPLVVAIHQLMFGWRQFLRFLAISAPALLVCIGWLFWISEGRIVTSLVSERIVSTGLALATGREVFSIIMIPVLLAAFVLAARLRDPSYRFIAIYAAVAFFLAAAFSAGTGVSINVYYDFVIALSLAVGLGVIDLLRTGQQKVFGVRHALLAPYFLGAATLGCLLAAYPALTQLRPRPADEAEFTQAISIVRDAPGEAMCPGRLFVCYRAGKSMFVDFNGLQAIATGKVDGARTAELLDSADVRTVLLETLDVAWINGDDPSAPHDMPVAFLSAIKSGWRPIWSNARGDVLYQRAE